MELMADQTQQKKRSANLKIAIKTIQKKGGGREG
jgi:hypothetical protein